MNLIKESVLRLNEYKVAQKGARIKLNQNESPYGVPEELRAQIIDRLNRQDWNRYPALEPEALINSIGRYCQFPAPGIMAGNGSNEIIQAIMLASCNTTDKVAVVTPGFSIYPRVGATIGANVIAVPLDRDFQFDAPALIAAALDARLMIFATPNNPTGTVIDATLIEEILSRFRGMLVVDEAYFEFSRISVQNLIKKYPNLVIIRTMSKAFSMAGLRLGYMLGQPDIVKAVNLARLPFSIDVFTQIAGEVLMENVESVAKHVDEIISERERVFLELDIIEGVNPIPSSANFILFEIENCRGMEVYEELLNAGILVRVFNDHRLKNYLRVTIGTPGENDSFLERFKMVMSGKRGRKCESRA